MGLPGVDDALHRRGTQQGLVAGEEQIVDAVFSARRRSISRFHPQAYAFPLPLFRRDIADYRYRQISGKDGNTIIGGNKKNPAEAAGERANQIQGMPRQGLTPEGNEKFVVITEAAGETGCHKNGENVGHWFIVIDEGMIVSYCLAILSLTTRIKNSYVLTMATQWHILIIRSRPWRNQD
jgi:hypothetical protein